MAAGPRTLTQLPDCHTADLQWLLDSNVITADEDEFGEACFSLVPAAVSILLRRRYFPSELVAAQMPKCQPWRSAPRIDLVVNLLRLGWSFGDVAGLGPRHPDSPYLMDVRWIHGAKVRLAVLANEVNVYCKGVSVIFADSPQHYHMCLLELEDLRAIDAMGDEASTKNDEFWKRFLQGKAPLALEDGEAPFDAGGEPVAAVVPIVPAGAGAVVGGPAPMPLVHVVMPDFSRLPLKVTLLDGSVITIHFDKSSHASRRPRCLTVCRLHDRCRLDRFIDSFASERRCVAFLAAWHTAGLEIPERERGEDHKYVDVQDSAVDEWEERIRSG